MNRQQVSSSMINSIGYDNTNKELEIEFSSGNTATYYDVPIEVYLEFMETPSKGKFFHALIKDQYDYD